MLALVDESGACQVLNDLEQLANDKKTKATAAGFYVFWKGIPREGPRKLGTAIYHRIDDDNEINEFSKGNHRLLCFEAEGCLIVCSHIVRKTSQKIPASDKKKAARLREQYLDAVKNKKVTIE